MKRIFFLWVAALLAGATISRAADAAVEERLDKLAGQLEELLSASALHAKRLSALEKELESVREQAARPSGNFASQDEVRKLWEKLQEIDRNRVADSEKFVKAFEKLGRATAEGPGSGKKSPRTPVPAPEDLSKSGGGASSGGEKGFEHVIAAGDSFSTIAQAYREKGVKVTSEQIQKANPNLKANSLKVGQKVFIPSP
jgi:hypothetical protein